MSHDSGVTSLNEVKEFIGCPCFNPMFKIWATQFFRHLLAKIQALDGKAERQLANNVHRNKLPTLLTAIAEHRDRWPRDIEAQHEIAVANTRRNIHANPR